MRPSQLDVYRVELEKLARDQGLDYYPVDFEEVPASFMMEIAVYGLPVRMAHWSFGVRYIYQLIQHRMGHSRLFEVVFPGQPGQAFLDRKNSLPENTLVTAHVLGHADFSKNNSLFRRSHRQVGPRFVERAAAHARTVDKAADAHGQPRVEAVLDAALALEQHIDLYKGLRRPRYPERVEKRAPPVTDEFQRRFALLDDDGDGDEQPSTTRPPLPPWPEGDLLWFIAEYGPELDDWERDLVLAVREESFYFYPVFACQIMNEGWASYWHARLLREADFLPQGEYVDAVKTHSDVVRPQAGEGSAALSLNPYHLGFRMWEEIVAARGVDGAREVMKQEDDFGFVRNFLTEDLAEELQLFNYRTERNGDITVLDHDPDKLREMLLAPKFNFGAPSVSVRHVRTDGTLELEQQHDRDGRGLDVERARRVLAYIKKIWRRPVILHTVDDKGGAVEISTEK